MNSKFWKDTNAHSVSTINAGKKHKMRIRKDLNIEIVQMGLRGSSKIFL